MEVKVHREATVLLDSWRTDLEYSEESVLGCITFH